jgi:hypothetical protein
MGFVWGTSIDPAVNYGETLLDSTKVKARLRWSQFTIFNCRIDKNSHIFVFTVGEAFFCLAFSVLVFDQGFFSAFRRFSA